MANLSDLATLREFQEYLSKRAQERQRAPSRLSEMAHLLTEEVEGLRQALVLAEEVGDQGTTDFETISERLVEIFIYTCSVATSMKIDLEKSFREQEESAKRRIWD